MVERFVELHTQMVWPVYLLDCVVLVAVYGWVKWALGDMRFVASDAFFKMGWFAMLLGILITIWGLFEAYLVIRGGVDPQETTAALSKAIDTAMSGWLLEILPACAILGSGAVAQFIQHRRAESAKPAA